MVRGPAWLLMALTLALPGAVADAGAQVPRSDPVDGVQVFGGVGLASLWDDETFLGRGLLLSGGVAVPLGSHAIVEGELAWASHHRDSGYLAADGTPIIGMARLSWLFRPAAARVRPFAGAGLGVVHSTGFLTTRTTLLGPNGFPIDGPSIRTDWSLTQPAVEFGAGVTVASGERLWFRPAFRWTSTTSQSRGALEPPLWLPRFDLTIGWRLGR